MKFGDILRKKREDRGMTQRDLAVAINTTQQNINSYETGYKIPPMRIVVAAADLFHCTIDEMIGRNIQS